MVPFLQSGHYEVVLGGGSFGKVDRKNLDLTVGAILTVDAALPAASVSSEVVVTAESPLLDTERTEVSQTVTESYVSNLPVNGRRWDNFVLLTPNVDPDATQRPDQLPWHLRPIQLTAVDGGTTTSGSCFPRRADVRPARPTCY